MVMVPHPPRTLAARLQSPGPVASPAQAATGSSTLQLVRSYSIPTDDPSYTRLLHWS